MDANANLLNLIVEIDALASQQTIFSNPELALVSIERIVRTRNHLVINNAGHVCRAGECTLEHMRAFLYRRRAPPPPSHVPGPGVDLSPRKRPTGGEIVLMQTQERVDLESMDREAMSARLVEVFAQDRINELVHICVPPFCVHLMPGHDRMHCAADGVSCPHLPAYAPADVYEYTNLFVCTHAGNVHLCGSMCRQKHTTLGNTGRHICPLTNIDLGSEIDATPFGTAIQSQAPLAIGYWDTDAPIPAGKTSNKNLSTYEQTVQRRRHYVDVANKVALELLFSVARQRNEVTSMRKQVTTIIHDVHGVVKRKPKPGSRRLSPILRAFQACYEKWPVAPVDYFSRFAVHRLMREGLGAQIHDTVVQANTERASHLCIARERVFMSAETRAEVDAYQRRIHELVGGAPEPTAKYDEAAVTAEAARIANAVVQLYENIQRHAGAFQPFKTVFLHLMYMMRHGHRIPVAAGNLATTCSVVVIPKFPILDMLPAESTLNTYPAVREHACTQRSVNTVSKLVYAVFNEIALAGTAYDYELDC